ncbi:MAG: hypothetical protein ACI8PB_001589 [Desulforhopalus sp.]
MATFQDSAVAQEFKDEKKEEESQLFEVKEHDNSYVTTEELSC